MNIYKKIGLVLITICIVLLITFFFFSRIVIVDNPTQEKITIKIDNNEYSIKPLQQRKISLLPGEHTLFIGNKKIGKFQKKFFDYGSLLNPTKSSYILESIYYGDPKFLQEWANNNYKNIKIEGETFNGPFEAITDIYFTKKHPFNILYRKGYSWDYEFNEKEPKKAKINNNLKFKIFVKIYRFNDFRIMYNSFN